MGFNLSATRFAHLLGPLARSSAARVDDDGGDDDEDKDNDNDNDARAEGDDSDDDKKDDKDGRKSKRSKKARADDDGDDAHAEDDRDDEARAADDDDNDGDKDKKDDARKAKHARLAERARCAQIFRCAAAGKRPDVAAHLAFDTDMRGPDAVSLLTAIASGDGARAAQADTLHARMAGVSLPALGTDGGSEDRDGPQAAAAMILAAARRARGEA